jgi:hypothetical protein
MFIVHKILYWCDSACMRKAPRWGRKFARFQYDCFSWSYYLCHIWCFIYQPQFWDTVFTLPQFWDTTLLPHLSSGIPFSPFLISSGIPFSPYLNSENDQWSNPRLSTTPPNIYLLTDNWHALHHPNSNPRPGTQQRHYTTLPTFKRNR